jgi:predicted RNase H-like nuclease (RuvC/YqgF family)
MSRLNNLSFSDVLKQNDKLSAELDNKDEIIKKLIISLLEEEDKNEKLSNQLRELQDLEEWCDHKVQETQKKCQEQIDFFYSCASFGLGTAFLVLFFKLVK